VVGSQTVEIMGDLKQSQIQQVSKDAFVTRHAPKFLITHFSSSSTARIAYRHVRSQAR
jgi:hypothetical protein